MKHSHGICTIFLFLALTCLSILGEPINRSRCEPDSGLKSPLDIFYFFVRNHLESLNPALEGGELDLIYHYTTHSQNHIFIFQEKKYGTVFYYGFMMSLLNNGLPFFPKVIRHDSLTIVKIVLEIDKQIIDPETKVCSDLKYSEIDYQR